MALIPAVGSTRSASTPMPDEVSRAAVRRVGILCSPGELLRAEQLLAIREQQDWSCARLRHFAQEALMAPVSADTDLR